MVKLDGYVRVATATPALTIGVPSQNAATSAELANKAAKQGASLVVFPELGFTGYTLGDLVRQPLLLDAAEAALEEFARITSKLAISSVVGLPMRIEGQLYNVAAVVSGGHVMGIVPKGYLPTYGEFYESRWYKSGQDLKATAVTLLDGMVVPVGLDLLFDFPGVRGMTLGIEICEDLWGPIPPSSLQAPGGATIIANLSASNELADKARYRRELVVQQSARTHTAYLYTSSGVGESTTDTVYSGHSLIAENGELLAESKRFNREPSLLIQDVDIQHLLTDRVRTGTFTIPARDQREWRVITLPVEPQGVETTMRTISSAPFVPEDRADRLERSEEIFMLQATALATRLEQIGIQSLVLGLSGGMDSTLALLVAVRAMKLLNRPLTQIKTLTMPGLATGKRTKSQAHRLAETLGVSIEEIPIGAGSRLQLEDIGHDGVTQDSTYQNAQARYRTMILMDRANQINGLVLGTGDLSEIALGWSTFTGDHISHYHVNAGVPKTLVRHLVKWATEQKEFAKATGVLNEILTTPISPELATEGEEVDQETESLIGPYDLNDFYLYHFIRWDTPPKKMLALAKTAFGNDYTDEELLHWLKAFLQRFFGAQWKRSVMPDGPKVGSVALSPRGDWRMPSVMQAKLWLDELQ